MRNCKHPKRVEVLPGERLLPRIEPQKPGQTFKNVLSGFLVDEVLLILITINLINLIYNL